MKNKLLISLTVLAAFLTACQTATPLPTISAAKNIEFTLAQDQTATLTDTGLTIRLIGVTGDERCPIKIECAISGPVSISLSVQLNGGDSTHIDLQSFTDNDGRAPDMHFEGIQDRIVYEGHLIRITGVLPYPITLSKKIKDSEYRVMLTVTQE